MEGQELIFNRINNPIGCPRLSDYARHKRNVLIVVDDNTRLTPLRMILPVVLKQLRKAGINNRRIRILIASGTHRAMTRKEILFKLGKGVVSRIKVDNHAWNRGSSLVEIGARIGKKNICVNKLAKKSDFIIGIGSIVPHATSGFSGGGKIILPGICGKETVEDMHWKALDFKINEILGVYNNPMRRMIDSAAKRVGLKFIVNTILDCSDRVIDVVAGDPVKAHQKGVKISRRIFGKRFFNLADIVVADAKPMDIDLRQAIKAVATSDLVVKKKGVIILIARCPEGIAPQFPEFMKLGFNDPDGLKKKVESGKIKSRLAAYTLIVIGRIMKDKAKVILISGGVSREASERLGFLWAGSVKEALKMAKELTGPKPRIIFLKRACEILPLVN